MLPIQIFLAPYPTPPFSIPPNILFATPQWNFFPTINNFLFVTFHFIQQLVHEFLKPRTPQLSMSALSYAASNLCCSGRFDDKFCRNKCTTRCAPVTYVDGDSTMFCTRDCTANSWKVLNSCGLCWVVKSGGYFIVVNEFNGILPHMYVEFTTLSEF